MWTRVREHRREGLGSASKCSGWIGGKGGSVGLEWGPMGSGIACTIRTHGDGPSPLVTFRNKKGKQERFHESSTQTVLAVRFCSAQGSGDWGFLC